MVVVLVLVFCAELMMRGACVEACLTVVMVVDPRCGREPPTNGGEYGPGNIEVHIEFKRYKPFTFVKCKQRCLPWGLGGCPVQRGSGLTLVIALWL